MKSVYLNFIGFILVLTANICNAQTINLKPAPALVTIDGNAKEWGANLPYSNDKAKISYLLSNDQNNLYLVIKTNDTAKQSNILGSGITLSINTKGSKIAPNTTQTLTFPKRGKEDPSEYMNMDSAQTQIKIILTKYRNIKVTGFAAISDDELSTSNPYGIQIAMGYDDVGYLVYEAAIPLTLFDTNDLVDKEWALNIQINGLERTMKNPTIHAGRGIRQTTSDSDGDPSINSANDPSNTAPPHDTGTSISGDDVKRGTIRLTPPIDFWVKLILAKIP